MSKLSLAGTESPALEGSGQGPTWGRREETQWSLKGVFHIDCSKFFSTLGQNSWSRGVSHCLHTSRWGAHSLFPPPLIRKLLHGIKSIILPLPEAHLEYFPHTCHQGLSQMTCQEG